jgi:ABC-type transport system substrate-binding protein
MGANIDRIEVVDDETIMVYSPKPTPWVLNAAAVKGSPFLDVRVRNALNYAVDKDLIVKKIYFGEGSALKGNFLMAAFGYNPNWPLLYPYDPEKAKGHIPRSGTTKSLTAY